MALNEPDREAVGLLPGENPLTPFPEDFDHWEQVYTELVDYCRSVGVPNARFERRLAYWRRIKYGYVSVPELRVYSGMVD
jgi:hypothetical protein